MNVRHCYQMAQLAAEEMGFGQGRNSPSYTEMFKKASVSQPFMRNPKQPLGPQYFFETLRSFSFFHVEKNAFHYS